MTIIINATPHDINFMNNNKELITFPKTTFLARVSVKELEIESPIGMPCYRQEFGDVEGLPESKDGTYYIVSAMVKSASNRKDLIAPNTGASAIRNDKNQIVAVTSWVI